MKKWESVGDSLPQVVDRMVALQDLHQQGTKKTIESKMILLIFVHICISFRYYLAIIVKTE
jgi:hypothetical protein